MASPAQLQSVLMGGAPPRREPNTRPGSFLPQRPGAAEHWPASDHEASCSLQLFKRRRRIRNKRLEEELSIDSRNFSKWQVPQQAAGEKWPFNQRCAQEARDGIQDSHYWMSLLKNESPITTGGKGFALSISMI